MFQNIPQELRNLRQWVVWRYMQREGAVKPTKVPYTCDGSRPASSMEPNDWGNFDEACNAYAKGGFDGIGFVFSDDDPFCGIDLDQTNDPEILERQKRVADHFQSYTEYSPSGSGLHIICGGRVPHGLKHKAVEVYSQGRFFTMTGNVWRNAPIVDYSSDVETLWNEVRAWSQRAPMSKAVLGDAFERQSDEIVYNSACSAQNGEKFLKLWNDDWRDLIDERWGIPYPSASEANQALVNILQFHSGHRLQIQRLFVMSPMGQSFLARKGERNEDRLCGYMINKAFDQEPAEVDIDQLRNNMEAIQAQLMQTIAPPITNNQTFAPVLIDTAGAIQASPYVGPPGRGLLDQIAEYLHDSAPFQIPEIALAGAIGLMAGIVGASHKVNGLGLNVYVLVIASTGQGKDASRAGAARLMDYVASAGLSVAPEFIGPANFASGPGIVRVLDKNPCFVSFQDEIGYRFQRMSAPNASPNDTQQKQMLLDLYSASTAGYAGSAYADREKSIKRVKSASVTVVGSGTPVTVYDNLSAAQVHDGLLPRFTIIEYAGAKPYLNKRAHEVVPSNELIDGLKRLCDASLTSQNTAHKTEVLFDAQAEMEADAFSNFCTDQENRLDELGKAMWSRAHAKTLKLAALAAVGVNQWAPTITLDQWNWAKAITVRETTVILDKFAKGEVGKNVQPTSRVPDHDARSKALAAVLLEYMDPRKTYASYRIGPGSKTGDWAGSYRSHFLISETFLKQRLNANAAFKHSFDTPTASIAKSILDFKSRGYIADVNMRVDSMVALFGMPASNASIVYRINADLDEIRGLG